MRVSFVVALGLAASGCATFAHDTPDQKLGSGMQVVHVTSEPSAARVFVGASPSGVTPAKLVLQRRRTDYVVRVELDGYQPKDVRLDRTTSGAVAGNLGFAALAAWPNNGFADRQLGRGERLAMAALLPLTGVIVDFANASAYNLPPSVHVPLQPVTRADQVDGSRSGRGPIRVKGRVVIESVRPFSPSRLIVLAWDARDEPLWERMKVGLAPLTYPQAAVDPDGTFEIVGLEAETPYFLEIARVPDGRHVASAFFDDGGSPRADVLDTGFTTPSSSGVVPPLVIKLLDWQTWLIGHVRFEGASNPAAYRALIYPQDRTLWRGPSRRIKVVRLNSDASFEVQGLPAGEYLVGLVPARFPYLDRYKPEFLSTLADASVRVSLTDRAAKRVDLRVQR